MLEISSQKQGSSRSASSGVDEALRVIKSISEGDFSVRGRAASGNPDLDSIIKGLNGAAEELGRQDSRNDAKAEARRSVKIRTLIHDLSNYNYVLRGQVESVIREHPCFCLDVEHLNSYLKMTKEVITDLEGTLGLTTIAEERLGARSVSVMEHASFAEAHLSRLKNECGLELGVSIGNVDPALKIMDCVEFYGKVIDNCFWNARKADAKRVMIEYQEAPCCIEVHIKDNGKGMDEQQLQKIGFHCGPTIEKRGAGIIRDLIHEVGGSVSWNSIRGIGTDCILRFQKAEVTFC